MRKNKYFEPISIAKKRNKVLMQQKMMIDYDQPLSRVARHHVDTLSSGLYLLLLQLNDDDGCAGGCFVNNHIIRTWKLWAI